MAIYSDEKRPLLARLIKIFLFIDVILFILLILLWVVMAGPAAGLTHTGTNATILIGLNVAAFLIYEQLFRPDDDPLRRLSEVLGSLQVVASFLALLLIIGAMVLAVAPGIMGTPAAQPSQPVVTDVMSGSLPAVAQVSTSPTKCYQTASGCMPYLPDPTVPPVGARIFQNDPIIGSFVFLPKEFNPKINYDSHPGNYEYNYKVVPLDHSPDIKWEFRDDGVLLFYDNVKGDLLRTASWTVVSKGQGKYEYRIKRGNTEYRGAWLTPELFQITNPDFWNMTKVG